MTVLPIRPAPPVSLPDQPLDTPWPTEAWPVGDLPDVTRTELDELLDDHFSAERSFGRSLAFVAVRRGRLIAERYGPTAGPDERLISWSMAKSITHALLGVLVADGRIDPHQPAPIASWHTDGDPRSAITIDHLLRMVPGTEFKEDYVDAETSHCIEMLFGDGRDDMAAYTAALPAVDAPDTVFNYSSGTTVLLCRIMADLVGSGPAFEAWMNDALLSPLGIEAEATFDGAGTWVGSSFLHATARDYAKFGLLYLRGGRWDGTRLLPEGWVDYARTPRAIEEPVDVGSDDRTETAVAARYGAHWWIWPYEETVFHASGYETQRIVVDPAADLVLVRLGKTPTELAPAVDRWLEDVRCLLA